MSFWLLDLYFVLSLKHIILPQICKCWASSLVLCQLKHLQYFTHSQKFHRNRRSQIFVFKVVDWFREHIVLLLLGLSIRMKENHLWIGTSHRHQCTYSTDRSNKIFVRISFLFIFNSCFVILIERTFYYFVNCKHMSTTLRNNGIVQFTFFLFMRVNMAIVASYDSLIVILVLRFFDH